MYISKGNMKMKKGFLIWNLPSGITCPGKTEICDKKCYARKAERQYKQTLPCRMANLDDSLSEDFVTMMVDTMHQMIYDANGVWVKSFKGYFRIHESGDFYSQRYLNDWFTLAKMFPSIKFLAFTKSFDLDFTGKPENLEIVLSVMPDTTIPNYKRILDLGFSIAYAGDSMYMFADSSTMPIECPGNCDECGACWGLSKRKINVHFAMH